MVFDELYEDVRRGSLCFEFGRERDSWFIRFSDWWAHRAKYQEITKIIIIREVVYWRSGVELARLFRSRILTERRIIGSYILAMLFRVVARGASMRNGAEEGIGICARWFPRVTFFRRIQRRVPFDEIGSYTRCRAIWPFYSSTESRCGFDERSKSTRRCALMDLEKPRSNDPTKTISYWSWNVCFQNHRCTVW